MKNNLINKKIVIIFVIILLVVGAAYAARIVLFGENSAGTVITYTTNGTFTVPNGITAVEVLVVAGGGGGGGNCNSCGGAGGGGAGGLIYNSSYSVTPGQTISVVVGDGGAGGPALDEWGTGGNGGNSSFGNLIAIGGGGGRPQSGLPGNNGGSGGGGGGGSSPPAGAGGNGIAGQGHNGGAGGGGPYEGGGGGGAGSVGSDGYAVGNGGIGLAYSITGSSVYYAGGGGGGAYYTDSAGVGGLGGGGNGVNQTINNGNGFSGTPNTGGGGGGANGAFIGGEGGHGGSGIVIIKYKPIVQISSSQTGLVGHWALNSEGYNSATGRVTDKSAYENHGTNYGATLTTDRMGHDNGAMYFDGGDYIDIPDITLGSNYSVSAWVNISAYGGEILGGEGTYVVYIDASGLWIRQNDLSYCSANYVFPLNKITYLTITRNNTNIIFYVNGSNVGSCTLPLGFTKLKQIGKEDTGYYFRGTIEDLKIYNRALSENEIKTLYNSYNTKLSSGSLYKGLVLDMPLTSTWTKGGAAGSEIMTDKTPYTNDGQNSGATVGENYTAFDGINDYVLITDKDSLDLTTDFTISAWIYPKTEVNYYNSIVNKGNWRYYLGIYNDNRLDLWINNAASATAASGLSLNIWYHIAWVHSSSSGDYDIVYVNGDNSSSLSINGNLPNPSTDATNLGIGAYADFGSYAFNGSMSDVRIYNRALSSEEIKLLYDKGR